MNAGTAMRAKADAKTRTASLVAVTLVVGIAGAVSMAAFTGARRADTAYDRFAASTNEPEVVVFGGGVCPFGSDPVVGPAAELPEVAAMQPSWTTIVNVYDEDGERLMAGSNFEASVYSNSLDGEGTDIRPKLLKGRLPNGLDEVLLGYSEPQPGFDRPDIGDTIGIGMAPQDKAEAVLAGEIGDDELIVANATVVGEAIFPGELTGTADTLAFDAAFAQRYRDEVVGCDVGMFQLRGGMEDAASFLAGVKEISSGAFGFDRSGEEVIAQRTSSIQAVILRLFGGLAALAALLVLGQVLIRRTLLGATDAPVLRALGMTERQLVVAALLPALVVAAAAAAIAVGGAIALSTLLPLDQVRLFEPDPGVFVVPEILVAGALAIVGTILGCVAVPAWRAGRSMSPALGTAEYRGTDRRSVVASAAASIGTSVTALAGTRMALEPGHGRTATPVRSGIVGLTLAVTAMVAAFGFAASMDRFTSTPTLFGIRFEFATGHPFIGGRFEKQAIPVVEDDPNVGDLTAGNFQEQFSLTGPDGRESVAVWGTEALRGDLIALSMIEGRWPETDDEIALGAVTARDLGVAVGETVRADSAGVSRELTVVGIPVFPDFGFGPGLGQGAGATMGLLRTFYPETTLNLLFGRFAPGVDEAAALERLNERLLEVNGDLELEVPQNDTSDLGDSLTHTRRARGLPLVLATSFGIVALGTLVHVLVTSVRRRRRDLAILRTIGFTRRQVMTTIAWQATTIAVIGLAIGVPLGFLVGRFAWAVFAHRLGVLSDPVPAWGSVVVVIPAVLLLANLVAIGPALFARGTRPAQVLRAE